MADVVVALIGCFILQTPQDDTDLRRVLAEVHGIPSGERHVLEGRLRGPWEELVAKLPPTKAAECLAWFKTELSTTVGNLCGHGCPRAEFGKGAEWSAEWVALRKSGLTTPEYQEYEQEHNRVFDRHFGLAAEVVEGWLRVRAKRKSVDLDTRSAIQAQLHRLMDIVEELIRPYAPAEAAKKAVLAEILRKQRKHVTEGPYLPDDPMDVEVLTRPLTNTEIDYIATMLRTAALEHAVEILIPKTTGDLDKDVEAYHADPHEDILAWLFHGTLNPLLVEIADKEGTLANLRTLEEELSKVADEHRSLDDRTYFLAADRAKAAWAEKQQNKGQPEDNGSSSLGNRIGSPESQGNGQPSHPPIRRSAGSILQDPRLLIALLVLSLSTLLVMWTLRRRRTA